MLAVLCVFAATACNNAPADTTASDSSAGTGEFDPSKVDPDDYNIISIEEYKDKTLAGHLAQYIGFLSGYEFARDSSGNPRVAMPDSWFEICNGPYAEPNSRNKHGDKLLKNDETGLWEVWNDDDFSIDILNQYLIADMYEDYGTLSAKSIKDGWVEYNVYDMGGGHRTYGAYGLFKNKGYLPPFIGMREYGNLYGVNGEPYIANETLGMNCAGMPGVAADLSNMFAQVTSDMDPVLWARFFATMYSMAYFESDIPTLISEARRILPEGCVVGEVIDEVLALREKYPKLSQWRDAVKEAEKICYRHHYGEDSRMGESSINCSFILVGLLWGEGDFFETCRIISLAGHGGDSTTPVGLGIVAITTGFDAIPAEALAKTWQDGEGVVVNKPLPDTSSGYWMVALGLPERIKMADVVDMYQKNFESILAEQGGFIYEGNYYIPKKALGSTDTVLYENFEFGNLAAVTSSFGSVSIAGSADTYMGNYGLKVSGSESADSGAYIKVDGLSVGAKYRYSAYVFTTTRVDTYMFARETGSTGLGQYASVYDSDAFVKREFVFEATAESMEIGYMIKAGVSSHKYAVIDDICVMRVEENAATDKVSITSEPESSGAYKGVVVLKVGEKIAKEAMLKITFANTTGKTIDGKITLNGADYGTAPFYKTGAKLDAEGLDCVYIPLVMGKDENTLFIDIGERSTLYVYDVSVVTLTDRFN